MENERSEGNEEKYFKSPSEKSLVKDFYMRHSNRMRKYPHHFDPGYGATRDCNSDYVASLVCMIHYWHYDRNVDMYKILYLLAKWDVEDCI